jgi:hypothetical protein
LTLNKTAGNKHLLSVAGQWLVGQKSNKLKRQCFVETTIELQGDHSEFFFSFRPIWVATQAIDFGTIYINHKKK